MISMCAYSVHSHQEEIREGFISLRGGHRAGISGTAVLQRGKITAVRDISSINLRIARDIEGIAKPLMEQVFPGGKLCGLLIAGPPSSGKTTMLRDVARRISSGHTGRFVKCVVVDERCEIGAVFDGIPQNNLGPCCDVLSGYPKGEGIWHAVRSLSPQVVVCDEIGGVKEAESIIEGLNCGVQVIATAHSGNVQELMQRPQIKRLLEHGAFGRIVQLQGDIAPGTIEQIIKAGDLLETGGFAVHSGLRCVGRVDGGTGACTPRGDGTSAACHADNGG
jgi:stage III sporulation protein AA